MNHTATTKNLALIGMLAAITAALTGTIAISIIQNAAAAQTTTDLENSGTDSKFKQKEKNNCSGFTVCCNAAAETLTGGTFAIPVCIIPRG
jgi:ABC-type phosphate transport system permease subunit